MKKVRLGDVFSIKKGKKVNEVENGQYNYVTIENLHSKKYSQKTNDKGTQVEENDILIAWDGANAGLVGTKFIGIIGSTLAQLKLNKEFIDLIDTYFVYQYLDSKFEFIKSKRTGATIPHVNGVELKLMEIPLPSLVAQKAIAAKLDKAQEIIRYTEEIIANYDALTQSLFLDMFGDPVKNEKGWDMKTIDGLVSKEKNSLKRGPFGGALKKEIFVEEGYLVYEQFHALNNDFTMERYYIDDSKFKELKGFSVKPKDIIISCSGVYLGKLAIVPENAKEGIINQALLKVTLNESIMRNDFFVFHFTQNNFKNKYFDANRGAGIPNFPPMSEFKKFPFINPPIALQNQFAERVAIIEAQKQQAQESLAKSQDLFNSLLQESFKN